MTRVLGSKPAARMSSLKEARCRVERTSPCETKVPLPLIRTSAPSWTRSEIARRTVMRETPNCSSSWRSPSSASPGRSIVATRSWSCLRTQTCFSSPAVSTSPILPAG